MRLWCGEHGMERSSRVKLIGVWWSVLSRVCVCCCVCTKTLRVRIDMGAKREAGNPGRFLRTQTDRQTLILDPLIRNAPYASLS